MKAQKIPIRIEQFNKPTEEAIRNFCNEIRSQMQRMKRRRLDNNGKHDVGKSAKE